MPEPSVITADRNAVLFRVSVPFKKPICFDKYISCSFPIDYFVYSVNTSATPSLIKLPPCFARVVKNEEDKMFQPYRRQQQRCMMDQDIGLLCHGDDDQFTVAHLTCRFHHEVQLCVLHHSPGAFGVPLQWRVKKLLTPPEMKINPILWTTDTIISVDGCLCWVDYYQGMLLVDVLLANSDSESSPDMQQLSYIPLPKQALKSRRPYIDAFSPDPFRHVCITYAGIVKLVCIFPEDGFPSNFTIITWSFDRSRGNWVKDCGTSIKAAKFFGMFDAVQSNGLFNAVYSSFPRVTPSFPVVSLVDPDIICFLLEEEDHIVCWMIEVNMRDKVLLSITLYTKEEEEEEEEQQEEEVCFSKKPGRNFYARYFIPSKLSSFVRDGFTSRELSALMQEKAIQQLVKQENTKSNLRQAKPMEAASQTRLKRNN